MTTKAPTRSRKKLSDEGSTLFPATFKQGPTVISDIKIHDIDDACFPVPDNSHGFDLKVDVVKSENATIPPRMSFVLDLGWSAILPSGFRLEVQVDSVWAERGLLLQSSTYPHGKSQRMTVYAYNVGKQILAFKHGDRIAKGWFVLAPQVALIKS